MLITENNYDITISITHIALLGTEEKCKLYLRKSGDTFVKN